MKTGERCRWGVGARGRAWALCLVVGGGVSVRAEAPAPVAAPETVPGAVFPADADLRPAADSLEKGDWRGARRALNILKERKKKSSAYWVLQGRACLAAARYGKARRRFAKALKFDTHFAPAYYWSGRVYEAQGKIDEAANEYQAALRADPKMPDAQTAWGRLKDQASPARE